MVEGSLHRKPVQQFRYLFWFLVALYVITLIVFIAASYGPFADGIVLVGWSAAVAICLYSSMVFRHNTFDVGAVLFFIYAAGLTILLMFNDVFRLDERVFSIWLNLAQFWFWIGFAIVFVVFIVLFFKIIMSTDYIILAFAVVLYTLALLTDAVAQVIREEWVMVIGDCLEFLGVASWAAYFIRTCAQITKAEIENVHERPRTARQEELRKTL